MQTLAPALAGQTGDRRGEEEEVGEAPSRPRPHGTEVAAGGGGRSRVKRLLGFVVVDNGPTWGIWWAGLKYWLGLPGSLGIRVPGS